MVKNKIVDTYFSVKSSSKLEFYWGISHSSKPYTLR